MDIILENLSKSFDGKPVLRGLNHRFSEKSLTCVTGPSGCGKTTLLKLMAGLIAPDSGRLIGLPERCAVVFQEDRLIEFLTAPANLCAVLGRNTSRAAIGNALSAVGLGGALDKPVRDLSGGMKRRVAIVRALLADAPLLLMDEPFKGLDPDTRAAVIRFAKPLMANRTTVLVTHDPAEAAMLGGERFELDF